MKNNLITLLAFITILICNNAFGQSNEVIAHYKYGDAELHNLLQKKLSEEVKKNDVNVCLISVTFAKFTIDTTGNIKRLVFYENKDTPVVFKKILASVIDATNGSWVPCKIGGKAVESKPFILPLIYEMESGCYLNKKPVNNGTTNSLLGFLDFKDDSGNKAGQLDCVLLSPLRIFSAN
jgi:hypothetical protein